MRKVLLFVLLFGAGLTVLLLFVREKAPRVERPGAVNLPAPSQFTQIPGGQTSSGERGKGVGIRLGGPLDFTQRSGDDPTLQKPLYHVTTEDMVALGDDVYDAKKLVIDVFNQDTRAVKFNLTSPTTRLHLPLVDGQPSLAAGETVKLSNVATTMNEGAPIVPLTMTVPHLEWHLEEDRLLDRFTSSDRVQLDAKGFHAEGTGLDAQTGKDVFELTHDGQVRLTLDNGGEAILSSTGTGPLRVTRTIVEGESLLDMTATEGAKLEFRPAAPASGVDKDPRAPLVPGEPLVMTSKSLHVFGSGGVKGLKDFRVTRVSAQDDVVAKSRGETFQANHAEFVFDAENRPRHASLDGQVVLDSLGDTFHSDLAEFDFDAQGKLEKALFTGAPSSDVVLGKYLPRPADPDAVTPIERELQTAHAILTGTGPLSIGFAGERSIDFTGPGKLEVAEIDFTLVATRRLVGKLGADGHSGHLDADGTVQADYGATQLKSESMSLDYALGEPGHEAITARTTGATTVTKPMKAGSSDTFTLIALDGLEASTSQGRVSIPAARRVSVKAEGPRGFDAHADLLHDLDWDSRNFVAEGNVDFSNSEGDGHAVTVVAHGEEEVELRGTHDDPARWMLSRRDSAKGPLEAEMHALEIRARENDLQARGEVVADIDVGAERQHLESDAVDLVLDPVPPAPVRDPNAAPGPSEGVVRVYHATATGNVRARFVALDKQGDLRCSRLRVDGRARVVGEGQEIRRFGDSEIEAVGAVEVDWRAEGGLKGDGDRFTLDKEGRGRLEALPGNRIHAQGTLGKSGLPYGMTAAWVAFDQKHVEGSDVVVGLAPGGDQERLLEGHSPTLLDMRTRHFVADEGEILLEGEAHAEGTSGQHETWTIDAGTLRIQGRFSRDRKPDRDAVDQVSATGGFKAVLGERARAEGETMTGTLEKTRIEGTPARLTLPGARLESSWIQYDSENMLLSSDKGVLEPDVASDEDRWTVTYESLQPFARGENTILVLRNPFFRQDDKELRSGWALFWVDRDEWRKRGVTAMKESAGGRGLHVTVPETSSSRPATKRGKHKTFAQTFSELRQFPAAQILSELYIEGNPELTKAGVRIMRATSIYLDLKEGRGWVRDGDFIGDVNIRNFPQQFRAKAEWMSIGPDGSLRAKHAVLTSCDYDDPHYVIETGDLRIRYSGGGSTNKDFTIAARDNSLRFGGAWAMPLPPLFAGQENGYPFIGDINLGDSARFGTSVRAAFNLPLGSVGRSIGGAFNKFLHLPSVEVPEGRWKLNAGYLGSRGILLGTGLEYVVKEDDPDNPDQQRTVFHLDSSIDGLPDGRKDRGLVRVDPDDRSLLRDWFRVRGRWAPESNTWWDLALSRQSDPGVQSEFFEREYLEYEQKDNYLHFRTTWKDWYGAGSAKILLEDRTDIEELPYGLISRGRAPVGHVGELPLYYIAQYDGGYLRRRDGDPLFYPPFPDGLGDRDVLRANTLQRLELPFDLGFAAIKATPFIEGRFTAWDDGIEPGRTPARAAALVGIEFGTTFWKRLGNGSFNAIVPTLRLHGDVDVEKEGGDPVRFDDTEDPLKGRFIDLSLRARWWKPQSRERLDVEVTGTYGDGLPSGGNDGIQPVGVVTEFLAFAGQVPIGFTHDGRYDTRTGDTKYSRTFVGFEPMHDLGFELGYHLGRDANDEVLYEAATFATRYRATQKWEIEFDQSYSLSDSRGLGNSFLLRRIGHDFVMETEIAYRAGEGASFNIGLKPLFAWKRSSLGLIDRWLGSYH